MTTSTVDVLPGPGTVCRQGELCLWMGEDVNADLANRLLEGVVGTLGADSALADLRRILAEVPPGSIGSLAAVAISDAGITALLHGATVVQNGRGEAHSGALTSQLLQVDVAFDGLVGVWGAVGPAAVAPAIPYDLQAGTVRGGGLVIRTAGPATASPAPDPDVTGSAMAAVSAPPAPAVPPPVPGASAPPWAASSAPLDPPVHRPAEPSIIADVATPAPPGAAPVAPPPPVPVAPQAVVAPRPSDHMVVQPPVEVHPLRPGPNGTPEMVTPPPAPPVQMPDPTPAAPAGGGGVQLLDLHKAPEPRSPLSVLPDAPPVPEADEPTPPSEVVQGINCVRGHFNHPGMLYCRACGIGMVQQSAVLIEGDRPPLGVLVMGDGQTFTLDDEYVIGREATRDAAVRSIVVEDRRVSRRHAIVALKGWDVVVTDLGSSNGTYVKNPQWMEWVRATPNQPLVLEPGGQIGIGGQVLVYESSARR